MEAERLSLSITNRILGFDWLIHPGVSYCRERRIFQATAWRPHKARLFVCLLSRKQQEWHLQKKNLDRYRTSYTCILTSYFCCFTCESISFVYELFTQRKCRVLGCTSNASEWNGISAFFCGLQWRGGCLWNQTQPKEKSKNKTR